MDGAAKQVVKYGCVPICEIAEGLLPEILGGPFDPAAEAALYLLQNFCIAGCEEAEAYFEDPKVFAEHACDRMLVTDWEEVNGGAN